MNSPDQMERSALRLLPHQASFVDTFFEPESKRVITLLADVGLGKSQAIVALVERLLQLQPAAKILLLVPNSLQQQFLKRLHADRIPAFSVERYRFREMLDSAKGQEIWPAGKVFVLGPGFAQQTDVAQALLATRWDLLIVDEVQRFRGTRSREALHRIAAASRRVILSTATPSSSDLPRLFNEAETKVIQWRSDQIVDFNGAIVASRPRPIVNVVAFTLSEFELSLGEMVTRLSRLFEAGSAPEQLIASSLLKSLQSSPAALERALSRIKSRRNPGVAAFDAVATLPEEEQTETVAGVALNLDLAGKADALALQIIEVMDVAGSDSKFEQLAVLLASIVKPNDLHSRVCILTEYLSTLMYLDAAIETHGAKCQLLHTDMNTEEQDETLNRFISGDGMVLAATIGSISDDAAMAEVTDLIFYDLPGSPMVLKEVMSAFDRIGRKTELTVHVLVASNADASTASKSLEFLRSGTM